MSTKAKAKSCKGKTRHATSELAFKHMYSLIHAKLAFAGWLDVYKCKSCGFYHVGHKSIKYRR